MNIFFLDKDARHAALFLDDVRVVKMILESTQILSTAHRVLDGEKIQVPGKNGRKKFHWLLEDEREEEIYKAAHPNHPCCIWARESEENYKWLLYYTFFLTQEYKYRFGKTHKSSLLLRSLNTVPLNMSQIYWTNPPLAMPEEYQENNYVEAYRNYFNGEKLFPKSKPATWRYRNIPFWVEKERLKEVQYS